jgi:hypothetical protein
VFRPAGVKDDWLLIKEVQPTSVNNMQLFTGAMLSAGKHRGNTFEEGKKRNGDPQSVKNREEDERLVPGDGRPQRDGDFTTA